MKYQHLTQICKYLQTKHFLSHIKRIGDNLFKLCFDGDETLFFDMDKTTSNIHKNENFIESKAYKAPFDIILAKRFVKSRIDEICVPENNRILMIKVTQNASYKTQSSRIYFEFTGRFTNVILCDEKGVILEALRHFDTEFRSIKVGKKLRHLEPAVIKEKKVDEISDFGEFFASQFRALNSDKLAQIKQNKILSLNKKIASVSEILTRLPSTDELHARAMDLSAKADLLKQNLYKIKDFEREISLFDERGKWVKFHIEKPASIALGELYIEAKKLRTKAQNLHIEEANLNEKKAFYENLKSLVQNANDAKEIEILLPKKRMQNAHKSRESNSEYVANFYLGDFKISVGKNEKGNIFLLKNSAKNDFWFHVKDLPSAHVIVKTNKQSLSEEVINFAAKICVSFSMSGSGKYEVDYTARRNVKTVSGALVNYVDYKTVGVLKP